MYEMKTTGLGFAQAVEMKVGGVVVVGGMLRRVVAIAYEMIEGLQLYTVGASSSVPIFKLDGLGWVSWQQCAVYAGRTVKQLAQEALEIQNACNPLGLSKGYARALQELRWALEVEGKECDMCNGYGTLIKTPSENINCPQCNGIGFIGYMGSEQIARHSINRLWLDKLCDLANYQRGVCGAEGWAEFGAAHDEVSRLAGLVTTSHTGGEHDMGGE